MDIMFVKKNDDDADEVFQYVNLVMNNVNTKYLIVEPLESKKAKNFITFFHNLITNKHTIKCDDEKAFRSNLFIDHCDGVELSHSTNERKHAIYVADYLFKTLNKENDFMHYKQRLNSFFVYWNIHLKHFLLKKKKSLFLTKYFKLFLHSCKFYIESIISTDYFFIFNIFIFHEFFASFFTFDYFLNSHIFFSCIDE